MASFRFELPDITRVHDLADWVEVRMLLSDKPQVSRAELIQAFAELLGSSQSEIETPINFLYGELDRRRRVAGKGYPLIIEETLIKVDEDCDPEFYKFLLLISVEGPMRAGQHYKDVDQLFDNLVCEASKRYMGEGAESVRFAWPPSGDRPSKFKDALEWLSELTHMPLGVGKPPKGSKDGGVDVVAWKSFADHMPAFSIMYVQCTIQKKWHLKGKDVVPDIWLSRIDTGAAAKTALAIPFVISRNDDKWDDLRRTVGIVFDRLRLTQMLQGADRAQFPGVIRWNKKEIAKFTFDTK